LTEDRNAFTKNQVESLDESTHLICVVQSTVRLSKKSRRTERSPDAFPSGRSRSVGSTIESPSTSLVPQDNCGTHYAQADLDLSFWTAPKGEVDKDLSPSPEDRIDSWKRHTNRGKKNSGHLRLDGGSHCDPVNSNVCSVPQSIRENSSLVLDMADVFVNSTLSAS